MNFPLSFSGGRKKLRARRCWLWWYSKSDPWKPLVTTLTVSIDSRAGTYAETWGSQTFVELTPSMRVLLELRLAPFTLNTSEREGVEGTEWASWGGVKA